jgi:hypothetical protein
MTGITSNPVIQHKCLLVLVVLKKDIEKRISFASDKPFLSIQCLLLEAMIEIWT